MTRRVTILLALFVLSISRLASSLAVRLPVGTSSKAQLSSKTASVVDTVAVAGATGRTGRYVVEELLSRGVPHVIALVRDENKAAEVFDDPPDNLSIIRCNLGSEREIADALNGADAAIWCATGFSDAGVSPLEKFKRLFGIAMAPQQSIDAVGVVAMAQCLQQAPSRRQDNLPKLVMLSSAGVTRPTWSVDWKKRFRGSAEIPIVRLNPFGILDVKRESEERLRESGVDYCIVRPGGLNDQWPVGSRPVLSQGDVAVGRIHRRDVARLLVDVLSEPSAVNKTFEVVTLANYPPPVDLGSALERLSTDADGPPSLEAVAATYVAMQQLLPGERQDSAGLAMGQTYEQLDQGKTGRLGKRGTENAEAAAPKPS